MPMPTLYLAGPIMNCSDSECRDWRDWVTENWEGKTLDPMRRDYRGIEDENVNEIVDGDKDDILNSDIIIVAYTKPSVGTSMEILFAWDNATPIILVNRSGSNKLSPWLQYHADFIVKHFDEALEIARTL